MSNHRYHERVPSGRLARFVECYWFRIDSRSERPHTVLPDGCVDLLFERQSGALTAVGLMTRPLPVEIAAGSAFFGVRFRPAMASAFLDAAGELTDRLEPLESLWGARARRLRDRLGEAGTDGALIAAVEEALAPRELPRPVDGLTALGVSIHDMARGAGLSARHLRRLAMETAGVPPKYLRRILRFRAAAERMGSLRAVPNWALFAAEHGYYDQAHFIREFQEFAGVTPGRFLRSRLPSAA